MSEEEMPTSRLQGWDYIKSLMNKCPLCGQTPNLGIDAFSKKYQVACFNMCCHNMTNFIDRSWGKAIVKWNNYTKGVKQ